MGMRKINKIVGITDTKITVDNVVVKTIINKNNESEEIAKFINKLQKNPKFADEMYEKNNKVEKRK
jgi:lipid A disaccharide synthetase